MKPSTRRAATIGLTLWTALGPALACNSSSTAPVTEQAAPASAPTVDTAPPAPKPEVKAPPPPPAPMPKVESRAEVEFVGKVSMPKHAKGTLRVWVCDLPCFRDTSLSLAQLTASPKGEFAGEIFVPQGTKLWFCAGVVDAKGEIEWQGSAAEPFLAKGEGELSPPHLEITLRKGPKVPSPKPLDEPQ
jgi:hypothetical protein